MSQLDSAKARAAQSNPARSVIAQLPWPCLVIDGSLKVLVQSQGFLAAAGNRSMLGLKISQLASDSRLEDTAKRVFASQSVHTVHEVTLANAGVTTISGIHIAQADVTFQTFDFDGDATLLVSLTLQKAELAQPHALLRQVGRAFAHEIANPLAGLKGVAQLLAKRAPELSEYTEILVQEANRINTLLARMRGQAIGPHRLTNVHQALDAAAQLVLAQYPNLRIKRDYDPSLPDILADADALMQVALNLLLNAAQAQARAVSLHTRAEHQVPMGASLIKTALRIDVKDDGNGVPESLRETLFLPLVTGRTSGSGFGLASALAIVEEHAGGIRFASSPGDTCFSVYLPIRSQ